MQLTRQVTGSAYTDCWQPGSLHFEVALELAEVVERVHCPSAMALLACLFEQKSYTWFFAESKKTGSEHPSSLHTFSQQTIDRN